MPRRAKPLTLAASFSLLLLCVACSQTQSIGLQARPTWDYLSSDGAGGDIPEPTIPNDGDPGGAVHPGDGGAALQPPPPPGPPAQIELGEFDRVNHTLSVKVTTPGYAGEPACDVPDTMFVWRIKRTSWDLELGAFEYEIGVEAADAAAGASGELKISVVSWEDWFVYPEWESHDAAVKAILIPPVPADALAGSNIKFDTLYAYPVERHVQPSEPVTIVVASGRPANPFQYMTGVRVTVPQEAGFHYVKNSFNVGAPGGAADDPDGFWAAMEFDPGSATEQTRGMNFLLAPDKFYTVVDAGAGLSGLDFNVTPLGGNDTQAAWGPLFNFQATFDYAGRWQLTFQQTNVVNRVYYQDHNQSPDYYWGDVSNNHVGIANSVTVVF
jgi:hypothetical protein